MQNAKSGNTQEMHICKNGVCVTDQVIKYQETNSNEDYVPIKEYYDNYKDIWYSQMSTYFDKLSFDAEYDFKLCRAVLSFDSKKAKKLAKKNNWTLIGMFNRWFFRILCNWQSNVKALDVRVKRKPSIQCPICGRFVPKIDSEHLAHFKTVRDLPKFFVWKKHIYETSKVPKIFTTTYGEYSKEKWHGIRKGKTKDYASEKSKVPWLWFIEEGKKGVVCPYTHAVVPFIDNNYIRTLPEKYRHYAACYTWHDFLSEFPSHLIQHEIYSLEFFETNDLPLKDKFSTPEREDAHTFINYEMICQEQIPLEYQDVFHMIDQRITDDVSRAILKLVTVGYTPVDIAEELNLERKEVRSRIKVFKSDSKIKLLKQDIVD